MNAARENRSGTSVSWKSKIPESPLAPFPSPPPLSPTPLPCMIFKSKSPVSCIIMLTYPRLSFQVLCRLGIVTENDANKIHSSEVSYFESERLPFSYSELLSKPDILGTRSVVRLREVSAL